MKMYDLYCNDVIQCSFCGKHANLYYINKHLSTKSCTKLQKLLSDSEFKDKYINFKKHINDLKCEIKSNNITSLS